jgi:hypothetical protein
MFWFFGAEQSASAKKFHSIYLLISQGKAANKEQLTTITATGSSGGGTFKGSNKMAAAGKRYSVELIHSSFVAFYNTQF